MKILISACLLGVCCTYKCGHNKIDELVKLSSAGIFIPICPEQLGGLSTPRLPAEIESGTGYHVLDGLCGVTDSQGQDVTAQFLKGAHDALYIGELFSADCAILKERSPSCGKTHIYNGHFSKTLIEGPGVTAALFLRNRISVYNESDYHLIDLKQYIR